MTEPHVGYRGTTTTKIKPGELCANCAKKIVPHINRDGMPIHYFTIRESARLREICRHCAEPRGTR